MATGSSEPKTQPQELECAVSIATVRVCTDKVCGRSDPQHVLSAPFTVARRVHRSNVLPESPACVRRMPHHGCSGGASACPQETVVTATVHCERIDNSVATF